MREKKSILTISLVLVFMCAFFMFAKDSLSTDILPETPETLMSLGSNEFTIIDDLIKTTEKNLQVQIQLKKSIDKFKESEESFLKDQNNKEKITIMVEDASKLFPQIKENHLTHLFPQKFISKLQFYSKFNR